MPGGGAVAVVLVVVMVMVVVGCCGVSGVSSSGSSSGRANTDMHVQPTSWGIPTTAAAAAAAGGSLAPSWLRRCACRELLANFTRERPGPFPVEMQLSEEDRVAFSHNGTTPVEVYVVDDTNKGQGTHYKFSGKAIERMVQAARGLLEGKPSQGPLSHIQQWFIESMQRHLLPQGQLPAASSAVVWGATSPWYEAMLLAAGVDHVTTIEYNQLTYDDDRLATVQPHQLGASTSTETASVGKGDGQTHKHKQKQSRRRWPQFDIAVSTSSFDHDGLGRYGDPKDPFGDIKAMKISRCLLKPGGLMFFAVPIGPDVTVYNLHRRYGELRLPTMLEQWEIVDIIGWDPARLTAPADFRRSYEPIFVLRKPQRKASKPRQQHQQHGEL
ncbi:hypothetical protein PTSG_09487 [Salpingoeca rosetta]|uniref:Uncharacterized protein n=1 Tax=Salpingoeca rosetta (strain ATCC 50818 / BSB-021) TaxID=946362 RepID=F2UL55_SALR5|nr:uncharacterized protein PTSG_09487 [Salpingoeca rosetta]EGD77854.1 hypothetical protein PTSG_09487 [Salpingoeca rosetta]|eukprot:XP_004989918.1 hypothetical protein PTSG_09487 [Salpingoeca rosetta]